MTKPFREKIPTDNPNVDKYIFTDTNVNAISEDVQKKVDRFNILRDKSQQWTNESKKQRQVSPEDIQEIQELKKELIHYFRNKINNCHKSILSDSANEEQLPWRTGADSEVYESSNGKQVYKYSMPSYDANPETIEYLRHKYSLLKKFLGDYIPKTSFFLGERLTKFKNKNPQNALKADVRAVTIQKRVAGKTFKEMTPKERTDPKVIQALKEAHRKYIMAKQIIANSCELQGFDRKLLDIKLDIGYLSKKEHESVFTESKIETFGSPNVIYDEEKGQVFFFDYDLGDWDKNKQKVFDFIMK
jgi:hypothetical protein